MHTKNETDTPFFHCEYCIPGLHYTIRIFKFNIKKKRFSVNIPVELSGYAVVYPRNHVDTPLNIAQKIVNSIKKLQL